MLLLCGLALASAPWPAAAQDRVPQERVVQDRVSEEEALAATLSTRLAYVRTGVPAVDRISRAGMEGLSRTLSQRTSIEPGEPLEVDIETDELAFYPLLYWPVLAEQPSLTPRAHAKLLNYIQNGGTVLFDTRDQGAVGGTPRSEEITSELQSLMHITYAVFCLQKQKQIPNKN